MNDLYYYDPELKRWTITFKLSIVYVEGDPYWASAYDRETGERITDEDSASGGLTNWLNSIAEELSYWNDEQKLGCSFNKEKEVYDPFDNIYLD